VKLYLRRKQKQIGNMIIFRKAIAKDVIGKIDNGEKSLELVIHLD